MSTLLENPAFGPFAVSVCVVSCQLIVLALWTGTVRVLRKQWVNPEDARLNRGQNTDFDHPDVQRVKRAHLNLVESALPFFAVALLYVLTGASRSGAQAYCFTFVGARLLHSVTYLAGAQPYRTISFGVGLLSILGMALHVVRAVI